MKIAFFEIQDWEKPFIEKTLKDHKLFFSSHPINNEDIEKIKDFDVLSVFIYSKIDSSTLNKFFNLKLISTRSTGFDHIDTKTCSKLNIKVANVPTYGENTVAEHTFALILALSRNIHKSYLRTMANDFSIEGLKGFDLKEKTLGVIGTGHIGQHVIRIAKGFQMQVIAYDKFPNKKLATELKFTYSSLKYLLKKSDIITLHIPYLKENYHLINSKAIAIMKPSSLIINTSRGELIDTQALLKALAQKKIAGAGLDVIEGESLIKEEKQLLHSLDTKAVKQLVKDHDLIRNQSVVFTPHIAFFSQEALERILHTTLENISSFIAKKPSNLIK